MRIETFENGALTFDTNPILLLVAAKLCKVPLAVFEVVGRGCVDVGLCWDFFALVIGRQPSSFHVTGN